MLDELVTAPPTPEDLNALASAMGDATSRNYVADFTSAFLLVERFNLVVHPSQTIQGVWCVGQCKGTRGVSRDLLLWPHTCVNSPNVLYAICWAALRALTSEHGLQE